MKKLSILFLSFIYSLGAIAYESPTVDRGAFDQLTKNWRIAPFQRSTIGITIDSSNKQFNACSGVALNQTTILTAAHCVTNQQNHPFQLHQIALYVPYYGKTLGEKITYTNADGDIFVASKYKPSAAAQLSGQFDLAIIKLHSNLSTNKLIPETNTLHGLKMPIANSIVEINDSEIKAPINNRDELEKSTYVNPAVYGLGWGSWATTIPTSNYDIFDASNIACQAINSRNPTLENNLMRYNLITISSRNKMTNELCLENNLKLQPGDSGGPLFLQTSEKDYELIGIAVSILPGALKDELWENYSSLLDNPAWNELKPVAGLQ